jgi:hypothetical protein
MLPGAERTPILRSPGDSDKGDYQTGIISFSLELRHGSSKSNNYSIPRAGGRAGDISRYSGYP